MNEDDDKGSDPKPPGEGTFVIPAGTKSKVRKVGEKRWRPFVTSKQLRFDEYWVANDTGTWTFRRGGFELKVAACYVQGRELQVLPPRSGVSHGGVSDASGKRTSRRQNGWGR